MALINKQKAIDEIRDFQAQVTYSFSKDWANGMNEGFDHAVGIIELMETVDAEPVKQGKWIDIDSQMYTWKVRCDQCGHERSMMSTQGRYPRYCENCGARMDGEDEQPPSDACDQISELVIERLKAEKILEQLGQNLGEVFDKIAETIDDYCNEILKEEGKKNG